MLPQPARALLSCVAVSRRPATAAQSLLLYGFVPTDLVEDPVDLEGTGQCAGDTAAVQGALQEARTRIQGLPTSLEEDIAQVGVHVNVNLFSLGL